MDARSLEALEALHVAVAAVALLVGPAAMAVRKRPGWHPIAGATYFWVVSAVSATGWVLAWLDWTRLAMFFWIGVMAFGFALVGYLAARWRWRHWLLWHAAGVLFSYTVLVGAFVVNNWYRLTGVHGVHSRVAFVLPGAVGSLVTGWLLIEILRGRRPRSEGA
jgi:hypothetical protein